MGEMALLPEHASSLQQASADLPPKTRGRGMHPNSRKNLVGNGHPRWQPGECGNPLKKHRPTQSELNRRRRDTKAPKALIDKINAQFTEPELKQNATWGEVVALRLHMNAAIKGDVSACRELRESVEGSAPQRVQFQSNEKREVLVRVIYQKTPEIED
jgi:hypothetical protein